MKPFALLTGPILALALVATPMVAQDAEVPETPEVEDAPSFLEEGAKLFLRSLIDEMEPALQGMAEGMENFAAEIQPMLRELVRLMDNVTDYHAPEMLPNGDIIIRKRLPGEEIDREIGPDGEIDL